MADGNQNQSRNQQNQNVSLINDFSAGIITDQSPLTAASGTLAECNNLFVEEDGSIRRRKGFQFEPAVAQSIESTASWTDASDAQFFYWNNVGNSFGKDLVVVYFKGELHFFDPKNRYWSEGYKPLEKITIPEYADVPQSVQDRVSDRLNKQITLLRADGDLVVTSSTSPNMFQIRWDVVNDTVEWQRRFRVTLNDFFEYQELHVIGDEFDAPRDYYRYPNDEGPVGEPEAPNIIKVRDLYANMNRGWTLTLIDDWNAYIDPKWFRSPPPVNFYPYFLKVNDAIDPINEDNLVLGNRPLPGGSVIVDAFNRGGTESLTFGGATEDFLELKNDRVVSSRLEQLTKINDKYNFVDPGTDQLHHMAKDITFGGIRDAVFAQSRMWYVFNDLGQVDGFPELNSIITNFDTFATDRLSKRPPLGSMVCFSQIIEDVEFAGRCHSKNDPTSEILSDPQLNDGGFIIISDMVEPKKIQSFLDGMLVYATNGIWYIRGGSNGFTPTSYFVDKISTEGPAGKDSIVQTENSVFFLGEHEIHQITVESDSRAPFVQSISKGRINKLYRNIPQKNLRYANGVFDPINNKVIWQYTDQLYGKEPEVNLILYNKHLVLDLDFGAFFEEEITSRQDTGGVTPSNIISKATADKSGRVVDRELSIRYPALLQTDTGGVEVQFSDKTEEFYTDFPEFDPQEAAGFVLSNPVVPSGGLTHTQAPHFLVHSKVTEDGLIIPSLRPEDFEGLHFSSGGRDSQRVEIFDRDWQNTSTVIDGPATVSDLRRIYDITVALGVQFDNDLFYIWATSDTALLWQIEFPAGTASTAIEVLAFEEGGVLQKNILYTDIDTAADTSDVVIVDDTSAELDRISIPDPTLAGTGTGRILQANKLAPSPEKAIFGTVLEANDQADVEFIHLYKMDYDGSNFQYFDVYSITDSGVFTDNLFADAINGRIISTFQERVRVYDYTDLTLITEYNLEFNPNQIAYDGTHLYITQVASDGSPEIRKYKASSGLLTASASISHRASDISLTDAGDLFVSGYEKISLLSSGLDVRATADTTVIASQGILENAEPGLNIKVANETASGLYARDPDGGDTVVDAEFDIKNQGSVLVRTRWDFTNDVSSGKFSPEFQAYRPINFTLNELSDEFDYGYNLLTTLSKIHGRGRSLQIQMRTEPNKAFYVHGWGLLLDTNGGV